MAFALLFGLAFTHGGSLVAVAGGSISADGAAPAGVGGAKATASKGSSATASKGSSAAGTVAGSVGSAAGTVTGSVGSAARQLQTDSAGKGGTGRRDANAAAPAAALQLDGGDIDLDFIAAGPFTYNHATGVGSPPQFGYDGRQISKTNGVVESLEGGDFACGDLVTFFTQVVVAGNASGSGSVELHYSFGNETTGQPGLGFVDIISADVNIPDGGNVGNVANNVVTLSNEFIETTGYDELHGTVTVTNLAAGETAIVRVIVELGCLVGASPTGNILNALESATADGDRVSVGQQTVPMKKVEDVAQPGLDVSKSCPAAASIGDEITYTIDIINTGNETLDITSVVDTVNGHAGVNITSRFPDTVAAGATGSATYTYTVLASDPDPLPNSVTVAAVGAISEATLSGNASCETDITHAPDIEVTKTCPAAVAAGADIAYTITVENTGDEPLTGVTVNDSLLGNITGDFDVNFANPFPVGAVATAEVTYEPKAGDPDPITNTVTARGIGADSKDEATDTASCRTDITHVPDIDVTKSCPASVAAGADIAYTITVENTGDEPLTGVTVNDSLLGTITGDFDVNFANPFPVGAIATAEVTYEPKAGDPDPITNTVTATGFGADSKDEASDTASCRTDITHTAGIAVSKSCPAFAGEGDTITYSITVSNTGNEDLENVTVMDSVLGDLSASFGDTLAMGASETQEIDYTVPAGGDDPLINLVTASGTGVDSQTMVTATDTCTTNILHPAISIVKTVSDEIVDVGSTVTYTYLVKNTGDTTLFDIVVTDDVLGLIGTIDQLEPGQSATLTKDFVVGDEPVENVAIARGHDILGREVSASDNAIVTPILPTVTTSPPPPTPFTGSQAGRLGVLSLLVFGIGLTLVAATRRWRSRDTA